MSGGWECSCARCGSSAIFNECEHCGGEGLSADGALHELDPLWYDEDDTEPCTLCGGSGGWWGCLSDEAWCEAHPIPGREHVQRGEFIWPECDDGDSRTEPSQTVAEPPNATGTPGNESSEVTACGRVDGKERTP